MTSIDDIAITGLGCISPIGNGRQELRASLLESRCAIKPLVQLKDAGQTTFYGARVEDFRGQDYVTPRKALKVMSREIQLAYAASQLAWRDGFPGDELPQPDRLGVVFGGEMMTNDMHDVIPAVQACVEDGVLDTDYWGTRFGREIFPLWMLKNLPNMPACHVGIAIDARGPNNTIAQEEVGGLLAIYEACGTIARGCADVMLVGGVGSRVTPTRLAYRTRSLYDQASASEDGAASGSDSAAHSSRLMPFDRRRRGIAASEGAVGITVERMSHAVKRGAKILGVVAGSAARFGAPTLPHGGSREAIASAALAAMEDAKIDASQLAHVSAQGYGHEGLDIEEAEGIRAAVGDVSVTAFSSYFGTAGAASGLLELAASLEAVRMGKTLPTLGFSQPDPRCPVNVATTCQATDKQHFLKISFTPEGHAAAVVVKCMNQSS